MNPIYKGQNPPKSKDAIWVKGKKIYIYGPSGWQEATAEIIIDDAMVEGSTNPVQSKVIQQSLSNMNSDLTTALSGKQNAITPDTVLSETSENPIENSAVYKQYMDEDDIEEIIAPFLPDYNSMPLTFKFLGSDTISFNKSNLKYSKNGGEWITYTSGDPISVVENDCISLMASANNEGRMFYNTPSLVASTVQFDVYGRLSSILRADWTPEYDEHSNDSRCFRGFFMGSKVRSAKNLILLKYLYGNQNIYGLYREMFYNCTNLIEGPTIKNATADSYLNHNYDYKMSNCYNSMFKGCSSLKKITVEGIYYALYYAAYYNTGSSDGYTCYSMFEGCSSLEEVEFPIDANRGYIKSLSRMFYGCTSLKKAPYFTSNSFNSSSTDYCKEMFYNCSSLTELKVLSTNTVPNVCTDWVHGVSPTGTFIKNPNVTWTTGDNAVPTGWTIVNNS